MSKKDSRFHMNMFFAVINLAIGLTLAKGLFIIGHLVIGVICLIAALGAMMSPDEESEDKEAEVTEDKEDSSDDDNKD